MIYGVATQTQDAQLCAVCECEEQLVGRGGEHSDMEVLQRMAQMLHQIRHLMSGRVELRLPLEILQLVSHQVLEIVDVALLAASEIQLAQQRDMLKDGLECRLAEFVGHMFGVTSVSIS